MRPPHAQNECCPQASLRIRINYASRTRLKVSGGDGRSCVSIATSVAGCGWMDARADVCKSVVLGSAHRPRRSGQAVPGQSTASSDRTDCPGDRTAEAAAASQSASAKTCAGVRVGILASPRRPARARLVGLGAVPARALADSSAVSIEWIEGVPAAHVSRRPGHACDRRRRRGLRGEAQAARETTGMRRESSIRLKLRHPPRPAMGECRSPGLTSAHAARAAVIRGGWRSRSAARGAYGSTRALVRYRGGGEAQVAMSKRIRNAPFDESS